MIKDTERKIRQTDSILEKERLQVDLMRVISSVASTEAPGQIVIVAIGETYYPDGSFKNSNGSNAYRIASDPLDVFTKEQWTQIQNLSQSIHGMINQK